MAHVAGNPLVGHYGLPKFDEIKPEHVEPAVKEVLHNLTQNLENLERNIEATWDGLLKPLEEISLKLHHLWSPISHLNSVANTEELRQAHQTAQPQIVAFSLRLGQSEPIYQGLKQIKKSPQWSKLNEGQKRIIDAKILDAELSGIGLSGEKQVEFNKLMQELSELQTKFSNNVLDATKAFKLVVTEKSQTLGMPLSFLIQAAEAYNRQDDKKIATAEDGPWLITLDAPSYIPFMENCRDRDLREKVYRAFITKAANGKFDNQEAIYRILRLRKRKAEILGFKSFAELSLAKKMAPSVDAVYQLEEELRQASWEPAKNELNDLKQFAAEQGYKGELKNWDIAYWSKRLQEKKFNFTDEELRPYFSLPNVLSGLFELVEKLFNIRVQACDGETSVWHKDVRFFKIYSDQNEPIAAFYLDPYTRPENKRGGAWMDDCIMRHVRDGKVVLPVAYLVCNSTPPVANKPSLLTFREVETLFHEFGHGLQHMLTKVDYLDASGINNIEWDAVELPSQFMENWCYHKPTLLSFAKHYETGQAIPDELFEKLNKSRTYLAGIAMLRQLQFGLIDMDLHHKFDPDSGQSPFDVQKQVALTTAVIPPLPEDRFLCSFNHIFAGGYAAGYYSYKWAEVLSADAFSAFEEAGLDNLEDIKKVGKRFRDTILACGGAKNPMDVFVEFRGRQPSTKPLLQHNGFLV